MAEEIVRNIGEGKIAIDTVSVSTSTYDISFLNMQKAQLESELAKVNELIAKFDVVKTEPVQAEAPTLETMVSTQE